MSDDPRKKVDVTPDKTVVRALSQGGLLGGTGEVMVDVKDGKIVRIRPFDFDWKYDGESFRPWKLERNGETLEPGMRSRPAPYMTAYKKRTYSPNRVKYPLKRIDWDPDGERNPQNRGKSKYVRISWDEATDIIAREIARIHKQYGPAAILVQGDGHGESKTIHTPHGHSARLLDEMGGFTLQVRQPDSWEGWYWGSKHVWGQGFQGMMAPQLNVLKDVVENCEMVLKWGCDDETTPWGFTGQNATNISYFFTKAGIKQVYICPELNFGAAVHADKWIPILPNTDAALQLAIIYVWLKEDLWDKEYVATHAVGMDKVAAYVLGEEDGVPKTPGVGLEEDRDPRVDDQGAGARVRQAVHLDPPLLRRLDGPRPVLARARPSRVHPARHAGPRRPRRAPVAVLVLRHASRRGSRELPLLQPVAQRTACASPCRAASTPGARRTSPRR